MASSGRAARGGIVAAGLVGVLALGAILLAVYALRAPIVADAGQAPGPAPTWTPITSSTPVPSASPTTAPGGSATAAPQVLALEADGLAVRSTRGACGGAAPTASISTDGGVTWTPVSFGSVSVKQILSVDIVDDDQIDFVAAISSSCTPTVVTSFTGGDFWASYPDRLAEGVYIDPAAGTIEYLGQALTTPCATLVDVERIERGAVAHCADGLYVYDASDAAWSTLSLVPALAIGAGTDSDAVIAAVSGATGCDGVQMRRFDLSTVPQDGAIGTCITNDVALPDTTLATDGTAGLFWSGASVLASSDGGVSWAPAR